MKNEDTNQIEIFEYPLRRRLPSMIMLGLTISMYLMILALLILTAVRFVSSQQLFPRIGGPEDLGTFLAGILIPLFTVLGAYMTNLIYPAVHVRPNGFRIKRLLTTSPWFAWEDIHKIEENRLVKFWYSNRFGKFYSVSINGMKPGFYSFVGAFGLQEHKEGFVVSDKIKNYEALMDQFRQHRPEFFD